MKPLRKNLRAMLADGGAFSLMVGVGETYLPAFALALGLGDLVAGLLAAVPLMAGAVLQLISPWAVRQLGSYRRWVVACAAVQGLVFVPLAVAAYLGSISTWLIFLLASIYWATGLGTGPAWNAWAGTLIPIHIRKRFFAGRTRVCQLAVLAAFLIAGTTLEFVGTEGTQKWAFVILFGIAGIARAVSVYMLWSQSEPLPPTEESYRPIGMREMGHRLVNTDEGRMFAYLIGLYFSVNLCAPFFTPYMLSQLELSYAAYVFLLAGVLAAKVLALGFFGKMASQYGTRQLLLVGGLGVVPLSGLWVFSENFYYLLVVQVLAGIVWAALELGMVLVVFESFRAEERTSLLTAFNAAHAGAVVAGSLVGGWLFAAFGSGLLAYQVLFVVSAVARLLSLVALKPVDEPVVLTRPATWAPIDFRILSLRPGGGGSLSRPVLPSLPEVHPQELPAADPEVYPALEPSVSPVTIPAAKSEVYAG